MEEIFEQEKEYLFVLKALNELPFPVGRKLLGDFLMGDMTNKSILKNNLYDLHNFSELRHLSPGKIEGLIEELSRKGLIEYSSSTYNKFIKVLGITRKGEDELINPTMNEKKISSNYEEVETKITSEDLEKIKDYDDFLGNLNLEQRKAVVSNHNKILCIAGAGSGKTTVLTKRVEFLVKEKNVAPEKILAITFTRKARTEMKERLKILEVPVKIETFNSFCEKILIRNSDEIYGRKFRVANYQDRLLAISEALMSLNVSLEDAIMDYFSESQRKNKSGYQLQNMFMNDCFSVLEFYKATRKKLEDFSKGVKPKDFLNAKRIYEIVQFLEIYMREKGLRTYSDQINDILDYFKGKKEVIPEFTHVLVDEYQDVNSSQVELLDLLDSKNYFFVGDPRQSIFGWRGSQVNYILDLMKKESVEVINLKKNYRSNSHLVQLMNESIRELKMGDLESNFEGVKQISLCNFGDERVEFDFVSKKILLSTVPRKDIFILARTNRQLSEISLELHKKRIPHVLRNDEHKSAEAKEGEVTLATIHSIKGLESEEVYVLGCTKNNFPSRAVENPIMELIKMYEYDQEEEERRLFYVAISRAKNKLIMTYSGKDHTYFITDKMKELITEVNY
ncbi:UvrD-helicase domain-containing protein [archaeon]|jgi:superfamily I DNA/RNA helicase/DNA-binding MarR family transcriptional regulator|nr:UvrD-helicase domain-containing protein [archaeon]